VKRTNKIVSRTNESYGWIKSKAVAAYNYVKKEREDDTKDKVHEEEEEVKEEDKHDDASPIGARSEKTDIPVYHYTLLLFQLTLS